MLFLIALLSIINLLCYGCAEGVKKKEKIDQKSDCLPQDTIALNEEIALAKH